MRASVVTNTPRHIIVDDFLTPAETAQVFEEIMSLEPLLARGEVLDATGAVVANNFTKRNRNLWLEDHYADRSQSRILAIFKERLASEIVVSALHAMNDLLFEYVTYANRQATLLSVYGDGDFYATHADEFPGVAANLFVSKRPAPFTGGNFHLGNTSAFEPERIKKFTRIDFIPGRLVLFPTRSLHFVDTVRSTSHAFADSRFSIQHWPTYATAT